MSNQASTPTKPAKPAKPATEKKARKPYVLPALSADAQASYAEAAKQRAALAEFIGSSTIPAMHVRNFIKEFNSELKAAIGKRPGQSADPVERKRATLQSRLAKLQAELGALPATKASA